MTHIIFWSCFRFYTLFDFQYSMSILTCYTILKNQTEIKLFLV